VVPWSEAELYYTFLVDYRIKPEEMRQMPFYDVYMIQYARVAKYMNDMFAKRPKPFDPSVNNPLGLGGE
jgi:hypothetical protein